jgi:hypothetical protein
MAERLQPMREVPPHAGVGRSWTVENIMGLDSPGDVFPWQRHHGARLAT